MFENTIKGMKCGFCGEGGMQYHVESTLQAYSDPESFSLEDVEKMVDVLIASDMVFYASRNEYATAILVTADNDLVPAIQRAKNLNRKVELLIFTKAKPKVGNLINASSIKRTARESYFKPIFYADFTSH